VEVDGEKVDTEVYMWNRPTASLYYIDPEQFESYHAFVKETRRYA